MYSILSLPVPLDLRGMLTAICMESSACLAWLARLLASTELSSAPIGRRPNVTLVYLPAEKPPSPLSVLPLLNKSFGFNVILIRHSPEAT